MAKSIEPLGVTLCKKEIESANKQIIQLHEDIKGLYEEIDVIRAEQEPAEHG